jgi:hypothetical protein
MNWYKRQLKIAFPEQHKEVLEDDSRINPYLFEDSEVDKERPGQYDWNQQVKRNARHHKKMQDIMPLEEEIKVLNQKLKQIKEFAPGYYEKYYPGKYHDNAPPDYPWYQGMPASNIVKKEIMNIERLIRRTDKKISTIMGRA